LAIDEESAMRTDQKLASCKSSAVHRYGGAILLASSLGLGLHANTANAFAIYTVGADAACNFTDVQAAVNAAGANPGEDYVWIANNKSYAHEEISVSDQDVIIEGGFTSCSDFTIGASDRTTLTGANGAGPIFAIGGASNVVLNNVVLTGANRGSDDEGGAIFFGGTGSLTISNITIVNNQAGYGAGIDVSPSGGPATLTLNSGSIIEDNTAQHSGGGIRVEGDTRLFMLEAGSTITINTAVESYGGGIEVLGPARVDIASPGIGSSGSAIAGNTAPMGGGVAAIANENSPAVVRLFSIDPTHPVKISGNSGTTVGGAFYLLPDGNGKGTETQLCLFNSIVDSNNSPDGAAIYGDDSAGDVGIGSSIFVNPAIPCGPEAPAVLGAVNCASGIVCNDISNNKSVDTSGAIIQGSSVIFGLGYFNFSLNFFSAHGNVSGYIANAEVGDGSGNISTCLIYNNDLRYDVVVFGNDDGSTGTISNCTITGNQVESGGSVLDGYGRLTVKNSIIYEPDIPTLNYQAASSDCLGANQPCLNFSYVLSDSVDTLPKNTTVIAGDPLFLNPANDDFHLSAYVTTGVITRSPAIDFAPAIGGNDLDGNPYDQDVNILPNTFGPRDLGAYEMQPINDRIFGDAFGDRLSLVH
jgi:hypothetical protein